VRKALPALAATLLLAAGAGCGGGDDQNGEAGGDDTPLATATTTKASEPEPEDPTATRPEPPPEQSRWAGQVDTACAPVQQRIDAVPPPADAAGLERWLADVLPLVRKQVAAVKAIKPPVKEEEARRAKLFVAGLEKLEAALTRYLAALRVGDPEKVQKAVAEASAAGAETRGYAASLGITECGGYEDG
jgi:hypothetical protein